MSVGHDKHTVSWIKWDRLGVVMAARRRWVCAEEEIRCANCFGTSFAAMAPSHGRPWGNSSTTDALEGLAQPRTSETLAPLRRLLGLFGASQKALYVAAPRYAIISTFVPAFRYPLARPVFLSLHPHCASPHTALAWSARFPKQRITYHTVPTPAVSVLRLYRPSSASNPVPVPFIHPPCARPGPLNTLHTPLLPPSGHSLPVGPRCSPSRKPS